MKKELRKALLAAAVIVASVSAVIALPALQKSFEAASESITPGQCSGATAAFNPQKNAIEVTITAPTQDAGWKNLEEGVIITRIDVMRSETYTYDWTTAPVVHSFENATAGEVLTWDDTTIEQGKTYYYAAYAYIGENRSTYARTSPAVFAGIIPARLDNFTATPAPKGEAKVTFELTAPTKTQDGKYDLTSIDKIVVQRQLPDFSYFDVAVFENPTPGEIYTCEDTGMEAGKLSYIAYALVGESGKSETSYANTFVGIDEPGALQNLKAEEVEGKVLLTWDALVAGFNGGWYDPEDITYTIEYGDGEYPSTYTLVRENVAKTVFIDEPEFNEEKLIKYRVTPKSSISTNAPMALSNSVIVGPPAALPFKESVPGNTLEHTSWAKATSQEGAWVWTLWGNAVQAYINGEYYKPQDNDGGMFNCGFTSYGSKAGQTESLISGKITLNETKKPVLDFYYYEFTPDVSDNTLSVKVAADGGKYDTLWTSDNSETTEKGWRKASVDLSNFIEAGYIKIKFDAVCGEKPLNVLLDNILVHEYIATDLKVEGLKAPAAAYAGSTVKVSAVVTNNGALTASDYQVQLYADNAPLGDPVGGKELAEGESAPITFEAELPADLGGEVALKAEVTVADDENSDNDCSNLFAINVVALAPASDLVAQAEERHVTISWTAPEEMTEIQETPVAVDDSFESYESYSTSGFGDWTTIDNDHSATKAISFSTLNYPNKLKPMAFMVVDLSMPEDETQYMFAGNEGNAWAARTRNKCLVACAANSVSDDWLISPELSGEAQTLKFFVYAPNKYGSINETFSVLTSSAGNSIADFEKVYDDVINNNGETPQWKEVIVELPEGTKYFAINYNASNAVGIAIDDISFIPATGILSAPIELLGYDIYCNGEKLNDEPVADTDYEFDAEPGELSICVVAVYNNGDATASNMALLEISSVEILSADNVSLVEYFDVSGRRLPEMPESGIVIIRKTMKNGEVKIEKSVKHD